MKVGYKHTVTEADVEREGYDLDTYRTCLRTFIESLYFGNEDFFFIKLCSLPLAFKRVCSGKWLFEVGPGGDGKSKEFILETGVLGEKNCATLDIGALMDRLEFRKSAHFAWNKSQMRAQEAENIQGVLKAMIADTWKRIPEDEEIDTRQNFGF